jgi:crotonobetaine/carnitine-CoA ligase
MPSARDVVLRTLIERRAEEAPHQVFGLFGDGSELTHAQLRHEVRECAAGLRALGARQGECVLCWLPNGRRSVVVMMAIAYIGAVYAPINTAYRGGLLEHVIRNSGARLMIADGALVDRLAGIGHGELQRVAVCGAAPQRMAGLEWCDESSLKGDPGDVQPPGREIAPWDTFAVICTSGTTGPSKGVLVSYLQVHQNYLSNGQWLPDDRALIALPMFHMAGAGLLCSALMRGGSFALIDSFRTQDFWHEVRRFRATNTTLLGVMCSFLLKAASAPDDRDHTLARAMCVPLSNEHAEFTRRFGTQIYTAWNMTETSSPLFAGPNPGAPGTCGKPRAGVAVRIVDENDCELPAGETGELIVRAEMPFAMSHGYLNDSVATAKAWRNGWFHTGDAFRRDEDGYFYFVDRIKDAIRRRGENISSFEVEKEVLAHPAVRDAAVVAVPSEHGEDEVLACVCAVPGAAIDFAALVDFLRPRLARFMVPRYFRLLDDLPRTPTNKVQKHLLRAEGLADGTWDREAAGVVLEKERLGRPAARA